MATDVEQYSRSLRVSSQRDCVSAITVPSFQFDKLGTFCWSLWSSVERDEERKAVVTETSSPLLI